MPCIGGLLDLVEAGPADMNDLVDGRELLGDPQADIGCATDDPGIGMALIKRSERCLACGRREEAGVVADEDVGMVLQLTQRSDGAGLVCDEAIRHGTGAGLAGGVDNGPVAGTAAKIAREAIVDFCPAGSLAVAVEMREQAHDNAGRTKAALRPMTRRHRRLHRMQFPLVREVLHRDEFAAVQLAKCRDAGVHRFIKQTAIVLPCDDHGTRAAIAFGAALLGSRRTLLQPQPIEHRRLRRELIEPNGPAVPAELDAVSGHLASELGRDGRMSTLMVWPATLFEAWGS